MEISYYYWGDVEDKGILPRECNCQRDKRKEPKKGGRRERVELLDDWKRISGKPREQKEKKET
jgi:hypothetical protein